MRGSEPFLTSFTTLRTESGLTLTAVAKNAGVSTSHLSRALRGVDSKSFTPQLVSKLAVALGLPADYFPETRIAYVVERMEQDGALRDRIYDELRVSPKGRANATRKTRKSPGKPGS